MTLSDNELRTLLPSMNFVVPEYAPAFDSDKQIQPASIDLRVDRIVWKPQHVFGKIDLTSRFQGAFAAGRHSYKEDLRSHGIIEIKPREMLHARTLEEFTIPEGYVGQIFTRSSFGRLGLSVTCNAGYINPGYRGRMPLQLVNNGSQSIVLNPLISIAQLVLTQTTSPSSRPYGQSGLKSKYVNDDGGPSRWWLDGVIEEVQKSLGKAALPEYVSNELISLLLAHDVAMVNRFEEFLWGSPLCSVGF